MKRMTLGCIHFYSGFCGFRGAVFCADTMPAFKRETEREEEADTLLVQSDVVGNLTATEMYGLSLRKCWSSVSEFLVYKVFNDLLRQI